MAKPTVSILGCGYVGLTTGAILANSGFKVYALELLEDRLNIIKQGRSFFYEAGLDPLVSKAVKEGSLVPTASYEDTLPKSDIVFCCMGTPDNPDGSSNLSYVIEAAGKATELMPDRAIFAQKSTVPVGTGEKIEKLFGDMQRPIRYVSNPEFLREGTAISDTLWFDRVVTGSSDKQAAEAVADLYRDIEAQREPVAKLAGIKAPANIPTTQYMLTSRNSAELIKVTANAFLALKISFANSIAKLADQADADVNEVMDGVGADRRIGRAFLNAGRGYGGGCFPKDVSGLIRTAADYGVVMEIMEAAVTVNNSMPHYITHKAAAVAGGSFQNKTVAVLGLAFKPGTSDARRSPAIVIANTLAAQGAKVTAYDPEATAEAQQEGLDKSVRLSKDMKTALEHAEAIFIATDWPEFRTYDYPKTKAKLLVDCMNVVDGSSLPNNIQYIGVGRT